MAGIGIHISIATKQDEKDSEAKYKGPVVYTNLPPPVLYFPNFPEKQKLSNRGSSGDGEDKRIEYVPFPYKDLPLLVYQSENQPPVHVVEKGSNRNSENGEHTNSQHSSSYQTGPAVYRSVENDRYDNEEAESANHPQAALASSPIPTISTQNKQIISIGLTSIQPQNDQYDSGHPDSSQQASNLYNQIQYSEGQNADQVDYSSQSSELSGQSGSPYAYYSSQYSNQNADMQAQIPVEQITQAIQNYLLQQQNVHQAQSGLQQVFLPYSGKQDSYASPSETTPHVGITIIRQPTGADSPESDEMEPQYDPPPRNIPVQINNQGYDDNPQYVSIGVFPVPGNDNGQDPQQYYNSVSSDPSDQYQNVNEDYRQVNQNYEKAPQSQNENSQTTGYQLISIDLSALRNQNPEQQRNNYQDYSQQVQTPQSNPPPQNYRPPQNEKDNSYNGREKEYQQILIQIPHNVISKQAGKPTRGRNTPYTGTAQVANVLGDANKGTNRPLGNPVPVYNRPPPPPPPPPRKAQSYQPERPQNPPNNAYPFPQNGIMPTGINIAIIKQTESTNAPVYKPSETRPPSHQTQVRTPSYPIANRIPPPPPPNFSQRPRKPFYNSRPSPPNRFRMNYGRDAMPVGSPYPISSMRYAYESFGPYRNKPLVPHFGGHPGIYASSNLQYTTVNPHVNKQPIYSSPYQGSSSLALASASKDHTHFVPSPMAIPMNFDPMTAETVLQAFTNNISTGFGEISFDEINAFLSPNYDLFGSMTNVPNKKKVEDEAKFVQKLTTDVLMPDFNTVNLAGVIPPFNTVKPPAFVQNMPFPYKYWEQPMIGPFGPHSVMDMSDQTRFMNQYSHMQQSHNRGRFSLFGKNKGKKRGLHKGGQNKRQRGLRRKLAELRTSIRQKSKITPRQEISGEETDTPTSDTSMYENAAPRSTIIKTSGLDGISIPLSPKHVLSSRISTEDDEDETKEQLPPIILYKGSKPPIEIYGSKSDIEKVNETKTMSDNSTQMLLKESSGKQESEVLNTEETVQAFSDIDSIGYLDYMYSLLPELIQDSFNRREDGEESKWLPVSPIKYALAEDSNDANETSTEKTISPIELVTVRDSSDYHQNSSTKFQAAIRENSEGTFSLLGKEEKSHLIAE